MYKIILGIVLTWVTVISVVWAQSTQLCSNGDTYPLAQGGGCCGDGVVQGYGGEECDFGYTFNVLNQNETWRRHDFRPMNVMPPTVCISTCRIEQDETNWYAQHSFQLFEAFSAGECRYFRYNEPFTCGPNAQAWRNLYKSDGTTVGCAPLGSGAAQWGYNESIGGPLYDALCRQPVCDLTQLYGCSAGTAINKTSNSWQCSFGGNNLASCTTNIVNGSCGATNGGCSAGTLNWLDQKTACGTTSSWYCAGSNGGTASATCHYTNADCSGNYCNESTLPSNAASCGKPATSPNQSYSLVSTCAANSAACTAACVSPATINGGQCVVVSYNNYSCQSDGNWLGVSTDTSCPNGGASSYIAGTSYTLSNSVCRVSTDAAPDNDDCDVSSVCDVANVGCISGIFANDNGLSGPGQTRTWTCGGSSCSRYYPADPVCGATSNTCAPGIASSYNGSTWTCSSNGNSVSCGGSMGYCGDGVKNQSWEDCDNGASNTNQCNSSTVVCSLGCKNVAKCCNNVINSCFNATTMCSNSCGTTTCTGNPGFCCSNGSRTNAPADGTYVGPTTYSCDNKYVQRSNMLVANGSCGTRVETSTGNCTTLAQASCYPFDAVCGPGGCSCEQKVSMAVHKCLLTGAANTLANCTAQIADYRTSSNAAWGKSKFDNALGDLYNIDGTPNQLAVPETYSALASSIQFQGLSPNMSYYIRPSPSMIAPGWVMITGGISFATGQNFQTWRGVTWTGPATIPTLGYNTALKVDFGSQIMGEAVFFYYCPSGACSNPRQLHVAVVHDRNNDGFQSYHDHERGLAGATVRLYDTGHNLIATQVTQDGAGFNVGCDQRNPKRSGFSSGKKGIATFSVWSDREYQVEIDPPVGYMSPDSAPYHQVQQEIKGRANDGGTCWDYFGASNGEYDFSQVYEGETTTYTSNGATGFTVVIPSNDDAYTMTRFIGSSYNTSLTSSIVTPQVGYAPGSTMQVRYQLKNEGYSNYNPDVEISILTGLVPTGPAVLSGDCPVFRNNGVLNYYYYLSDNMDETTKSFRKDCDFHHSWSGQAGRCNMMYAEGMFVTYDNGGNLVTTYSSESDKYPLSVLDTFLYSKQTSDPYPWTTRRRPIGHGIYMSFSGDVANYDAQRKSVPGLIAGGVCDITFTYLVSGGVLGQTYRSRACSLPQDDNSSPATDELDKIPHVLGDNCSNIDYQIGMPDCLVPVSLGSGSLPQGSGVVARRDNLVTPSDSIARCESEYRVCNNTVLGGSFTYPSCTRQCFQTWAGNGTTTGVNPGSIITGQATIISNPLSGSPSCACEQGTLSCISSSITGGALADPNGRPYSGGRIQGASDRYIYPTNAGCQLDASCRVDCAAPDVDLYEIHYSMSGNTALSENRIVDQVHPNICIKPSSFTGKTATNEVRITFFSGSNTGVSYPLLTNISGSLLAGNTGKNAGLSYTNIAGQTYTGYICGPYVQYEFAKPLNPGAEGYFFYEYKIKNSISQDPNANSGSNCVWIYRQSNTGISYLGLPPTILTSLTSTGVAALDPGDLAQRFVNARSSWSPFSPGGDLISSVLGGNNYVCVPPPKSTCPANTVQQNTLFPVNVCGNGVQELNEQCDEGIMRNNDSGAFPFTGLSTNDPLYGNYCKTSCELGYPLVCNSTNLCNNDNITSIQLGEQYPFWWNFGVVLPSGVEYNSGFTSSCSQAEHANKIIYAPGVSVPMCTFELFNFDTSTGTSLYQFTVPCAGTGVTGLQMFNPNADKWVHEKIGLLDSAISPLSVNQPIVSKLDTEGTIPSINKGALDQMRPRMLLSQSSKIIPMSNAITKGRMGDYEIRLTTMSYLVCHQSAVYNTEPDGTKTLSGYQYTLESGQDTAKNGFCKNSFVVTAPYIIQEGSLLSKLPAADFSKFYTWANRLADQSLSNTYGELLARNTQVLTYVSTLGVDSEDNSAFISKFITKYTRLLGSDSERVSYSHSFEGLSGAQNSSNVTMLKIPTREIYIYTGSQPLFVSDYGFSHLSDFPNPNPLKVSTNFTLIATNAPIIVFGELKTKNIMLITNQSISFVGGSLSKEPQYVKGIFVAGTYDGSTILSNADSSKRWIDDGRLVVNGILIGGDTNGIDSLSKSRRSVIENWYSGSGTTISDSAVLAKKKKALIDGASLRIIPNPQLFISPPPGATELFESLSVGK